MFIDSHAHIDITSDQKRFMDFDKKKHLIPIELSDLFPPDLDYVVHISLNPFDFLKNYPIFKQYPKMLYATGIYPDHAAIKDFDEDHYIAELKKVLLELNCVWITQTSEHSTRQEAPCVSSMEISGSCTRSCTQTSMCTPLTHHTTTQWVC
jgi:Tat protein secretion system quality control protein TatD with DNase activity